MSDKLCEFTNEGIVAFTKWVRSGAPGNVPADLLSDPAFSIANQLALTYDIRNMPTGNFLQLLPEEFSARW